jgi:hypothetical protein
VIGGYLQPRAERIVNTDRGAFREAEVSDDANNLSLVWWRYQVAGRNIAAPFTEQLWYGVNALVWQPPAGLIALHTPCGGDCDDARRALADFVASSGLR